MTATLRGRCIRVDGLHWDDDRSSADARAIAKALLEAADDLDRLEQLYPCCLDWCAVRNRARG